MHILFWLISYKWFCWYFGIYWLIIIKFYLEKNLQKIQFEKYNTYCSPFSLSWSYYWKIIQKLLKFKIIILFIKLWFRTSFQKVQYPLFKVMKFISYLILCYMSNKMIDRFLWLLVCVAEGEQAVLLIRMDRL